MGIFFIYNILLLYSEKKGNKVGAISNSCEKWANENCADKENLDFMFILFLFFQVWFNSFVWLEMMISIVFFCNN